MTEETADVSGIAERLARVRSEIADAAKTAGRSPESVRLLAVSKTKSATAIRAAYEAGQRDFGENYAQELVEKAEALADLRDLRWHAIGTLQRNKAKAVARIAAVFHAIDREDIAIEIAERAAQAGRVIDALIEVNVGGEASKGGVAPSEVRGLFERARGLEGLRLVGLMTIPPPSDDPSLSRPHFARLRAIRDELGGASVVPELSMGMTHDFRVAIEEGATIVRVGTAIFGARGV